MLYFIDEEFIEDGKTIDLVSIGIIAEDGRELYLQSVAFDPDKASQWVQDHVFSSLVVCPHLSGNTRGRDAHVYGQCTFEEPDKGIAGAYTDCPWRTREQIKREILAFMDIEKYGKPVLIGYYSAYDHVAFCQIFGTMMDLPRGFPMYTKDIKQMCNSLGNPKLPEQGEGEHNALSDAKHNRVMYEFLLNYQGEPENILHESHDY